MKSVIDIAFTPFQCTGCVILYNSEFKRTVRYSHSQWLINATPTVPRLVMGENDTFIGGEDWLANKGIEVVNLSTYHP